MEKAREDLRITPESISENHVYVLEKDSAIAGFFCLIMGNGRKELDFFFVEPGFIGKGYGKALWEGFLEIAGKVGGGEIKIIADPNAVGFYEKMGAIIVGEYTSTLFENRKLPLMKVIV
jgi:GNAT superfamily N-acetyltransferase